MAKLTWKGWRTDLSDAPTPTGPVVKRDGSKVITITLPPRPKTEEPKR
jgi:hypothetical protein